jgi:hypothetical protein
MAYPKIHYDDLLGHDQPIHARPASTHWSQSKPFTVPSE